MAVKVVVVVVCRYRGGDSNDNCGGRDEEIQVIVVI